MYEYKILDREQVNVGKGSYLSLYAALNSAAIRCKDAEAVLNVLAQEGWEPVLLSPPYIFRRARKDE